MRKFMSIFFRSKKTRGAMRQLDHMKTPSDLEIGARLVQLDKHKVEHWISMTEDWIEEYMKDDAPCAADRF